jgi:murein DD-endopeptidase MepM/ murein hydrolase activator NlpD
MKQCNVISGFLVVIPLVLFTLAHAHDYQVEILPTEINPGDAFLVKVTGMSSETPVAVFKERNLHFSQCGENCFIAVNALDINTNPGNYTVKVSVGKHRKDIKLPVKSKQFPEIKLTLPEEKVSLSPENLKRAQEEDEKLKSLWEMDSHKLWEGKFIVPLENTFSTVFGTKRIMNEKKVSVHRGLDIRGKKGEEVKASNRGKVVLAEELFFGGNTVVLDHGLLMMLLQRKML